MPLKLLTLNIHADRHLEQVRSAIAAHLPDVVCLQEVLEENCAEFAAVGGYDVKFALSALTETSKWGNAVLTRVPVRQQALAYYSADSNMRLLKVANDLRRLLLMTELVHQGQLYRIATTHFTWSPGGQIIDEQRDDFARLREALAPYPDYVLCGDFNAPRGREMFAKFTDELGLVDHLPPDVTTTIDAKFHYAGALELAVDTVFATPEYEVTDVTVLDGLSDHKGILATIGKRSTAV